jgi:hypothetical protein
VQADAFLPDDDGAYVHSGCRFYERVQRISKKNPDSFFLQNVGNGIDDFHELSPPDARFGPQSNDILGRLFANSLQDGDSIRLFGLIDGG